MPAQVFQAERWGPQTYTLPVHTSSKMTVRLLFAERFRAAQKVGSRQFNIAINGAPVATNYDIWSQQGQSIGSYSMLTSDVTPVNGTVTITLSKGAVGNPTIDALLIDPAH